MDITRFDGEHRWLSNFWPCPVYWAGLHWTSSEHAYQAAKTLVTEEREMIQALKTPHEAKYMGKRITMRPDWDTIKQGVMFDIAWSKFSQNADLAEKLVATTGQLIEGNTWGDTYWGVCRGTGDNHLGRILMMIREDLRQ